MSVPPKNLHTDIRGGKPPIAQAVADLRRATGFSLFRFAIEVGVSKDTAAAWEAGRRKPGSWNCQALMELAERMKEERLTQYFFGLLPVTFATPTSEAKNQEVGANIPTRTYRTELIALRGRLGETPESMARRLNCPVSIYQTYEAEKNTVTPNGEVMVKILSLCPDDESRASFGLQQPEDKHTEPYMRTKGLDISGKGGTIPSSRESLAPIKTTSEVRAHDHSSVPPRRADGQPEARMVIPTRRK